MEIEKDKKYNIVLGLMIFFFILVVGISIAWGLSSIGKPDNKGDIKTENVKEENILENKKQYTITFDTDGGNEISNQKVTSGEKAIMPTNPSKDKYTFVEWQLDGKTFDFDTIIEEDIELVAKWKEAEKKQYTITFNTNGGSNVVAQKIEEGAKANKPTTPTKNGYTFTSWTLDGKAFDFNTAITKDITLTANWKAAEKAKYTVLFNSNGGTGVSSQTIVDGNKASKPSNPTRNGYTFTGWTLNGSTFDFNTAITKNITLTAGWQSILDLTGRKCINEEYDPGYNYVYTYSPLVIDNFISVKISNGKVYLHVDNIHLADNVQMNIEAYEDYELTNIDVSKVSQIFVSTMYGNDIGVTYPEILFLMSDGTIRYLDTRDALINFDFVVDGKLSQIKDIVKLSSATVTVSDKSGQKSSHLTIIAIKKDGSFYNLAYDPILQSLNSVG